MKVYLVTHGDYSDYGIDKIFSTEEKAISYINKEVDRCPGFAEKEFWRIEIWEVE